MSETEDGRRETYPEGYRSLLVFRLPHPPSPIPLPARSMIDAPPGQP